MLEELGEVGRVGKAKSYFRELFVLKNVDGSRKIFKYVFSQNPAQA